MAATTPTRRPMKKNVGALCTMLSITRPRTIGTTTAAAMNTDSPRSSIPDGPWPAVPRSPAGDIPLEVYRSLLTGRAAHKQLAHRLPEREGDASARRPKPLSHGRRKHDDHEDDHYSQDSPVTEDRQSDRAQDAGGAVEEKAGLALGKAEAEKPVVNVLRVRPERRPSVTPPSNDGDSRIHDRKAHCQQRNGDRRRNGHLGHASHRQQSHCQAQEIRSRVAHEDA